MYVYDFCRNVDWRVVESLEDIFLGLKYVVLLTFFFWSFYLLSLSPLAFWNMWIILLFNISWQSVLVYLIASLLRDYFK